MSKTHAKYRQPSSAKRWLSCPFSAQIVAMYPNDETEASLKGDYWHELMEDRLVYGILPITADPEIADAMDELSDYVQRRFKELGPDTKMYVEQSLMIPETGEPGTADVVLVSSRLIEIIDEKSGYVPVEVKMNPQLLTYLLGAIAIHGERKTYRVTLHQPNYDHRDGTLRSYDVTPEEVEWFRNEVKYSMNNPDEVKAGKHCKDSYCPHRGSCETFMQYVQSDLLLGWHPSEVNSISDDMLASALDAADELSGWRDKLRGEAMKRIINLDRSIHGYKVVKGRKQRAVREPASVVRAVWRDMGPEWATKLFPSLEWLGDQLTGILNNVCDTTMGITPIPDHILKCLGTAKDIENVIRAYARVSRLPRGGWKAVYDNVVGEYITENAGGLTLERAIDGRPAHKRGSEFGPLEASPDAASKDIKIL